MIYDSTYWKNSLRAHVRFLNEKLQQRVWRQSSFSKVEQSVMLSCYIVRKLAEARKISDKRFRKTLKMRRFRATGETVDLLNAHKIDELYELSDGSEVTKPLSYIVNQVIHSFIFVPVFEEAGKIRGFAFNSDRSKSIELYMLELRGLVEALAACADSYISKASYFRLDNGELRVVLDES
jgi:hypothetical protein